MRQLFFSFLVSFPFSALSLTRPVQNFLLSELNLSKEQDLRFISQPLKNKLPLSTRQDSNLSLIKFWSQDSKSSSGLSSLLLAQSKTFDPFIDYGDFQDNVTEEESISFFQHGRSLSVILSGGYQGVTFNMRQIYGDALLYIGLNVSFFIDFHIAFQLSGTFPAGHYNSLFDNTHHFFFYGLDMKYYWHKQYVNEEQAFLNPYLIAGPFRSNVKGQAPGRTSTSSQRPIVTKPVSPSSQKELSQLERDNIRIQSDFGLKTGIGLEINIMDPIFISFEAVHLYINYAPYENADLSKTQNLVPLPETPPNPGLLYWLQYPARPNVRGYKFYGDMFHITAQVGINF